MNETQRIQSQVTEINGCISMAAKRQYGLLKLAEFLERCTSGQEQHLFEAHCTFWLQTLYQIFENHPVALHAKLAYYCFYLIVQNSRNASPELTRLLSTQFVEKGVTHLIKSSDTLAKSSLMCLNELINNYKASTSQFRPKIEAYVLSKLDNQPDDVTEWASVCYAKLPYMHKNQNNSSLDNWYVYFKNALTQANSILNELFEDLSPQFHSDLNGSKSHTDSMDTTQSITNGSQASLFANKIVKDTENLEIYYQRMLNRFRACCSCMKNLFTPLRDESIVKIRPMEIVKFLNRIFMFDFKRLAQSSRQNLESLFLSQIMSDLLNSALEFGDKFLRISGTNLLTHSNTISHMLAHLGQNLYEFKYMESVPVFYDCLTGWIVSTGANSNFYQYSTLIVESLLERIKPFTKNSLLIDQSKIKTKLNNTPQAGGSSKSLFDEKSSLNSHQQAFARHTSISSLKFLRVFMEHFDTRLTCNQIEQIQETIVDVLLCIQYNFNIRQPYDQPEARMALYENLFQLCFSRNSKLAAPLAIAVNLFQSALDDQATQIRVYAQQSLLYLRALTLPTKPAYQLDYTLKDTPTVNHSSSRPEIKEPGQQETASLGVKLNSLFNHQSESLANGSESNSNLDEIKSMLDIGQQAESLSNGGQKRKRSDQERDELSVSMNEANESGASLVQSSKKFQGQIQSESESNEGEETGEDEEDFEEELSEEEGHVILDDEDEMDDEDQDETGNQEDLEDQEFEEDSMNENSLEDDDNESEEESVDEKEETPAEPVVENHLSGISEAVQNSNVVQTPECQLDELPVINETTPEQVQETEKVVEEPQQTATEAIETVNTSVGEEESNQSKEASINLQKNNSHHSLVNGDYGDDHEDSSRADINTSMSSETSSKISQSNGIKTTETSNNKSLDSPVSQKSSSVVLNEKLTSPPPAPEN